MVARPERRDLRIIGYHLGRILAGLSLIMLPPALVALALGEWNSATALLTGVGTTLAIGQLTEWRLATRSPLTLAHGTVVVALAWLLGSLLASIPILLSGHVDGVLDAWFEAMSGLTTSGLTVVQDLDHLSYSMNLYRHLTHFAGGQGIVIVVLALFAAGSGLGTLYAAEGRDERVMPNVTRTARFIFRVALVYLVVGTAALTGALWAAGIPGWRGLWHGVNLFVAAFDTGGFTPMSTSVGYYHSAGVEAVLVVLMLAGTVSFILHYQLWMGRHRDATETLEVRTLAVTLVTLTSVTMLALAVAGSYLDAGGLVRKGAFTVLSAHSGTGFAVTSGTLLVTDWAPLAVVAVLVAMGLGGMAGSTAGGIKAIRVAVGVKGVLHDIRRLLLPESAMVMTTYHAGRDRILRDRDVRGAMTILLLYLATYLVGAAVALATGPWTATEALFESVSAAANVGLSVGITAPEMPTALQVTYLLQMWLGRLEFFAAFALIGYAVALARGRT
jgi:trk system potassium uptake protein